MRPFALESNSGIQNPDGDAAWATTPKVPKGCMFVVEYVSGFAQLSAYSALVAFYISFKDPDGKDLMVIPQCELTPGNHLYTFGSVTKMYVAENTEISMLYWFKDAVIEGTGANFIGYLDTMPKPVGSLIGAVIQRAIPRVAWR